MNRKGFRDYSTPCLITESQKKEIAYEQAVKAYQFQVTRYNTWMNYYALFVGALFVGFYNVPKNSLECLPILISLLGIVASTCWMASLIGNCAWMKNYIKAVKKNEAIFFGEKDTEDKKLVVYRSLIKKDSSDTNAEKTSETQRNEEVESSRYKWWKKCLDWIKEKRKTFINWIKKKRESYPDCIKKLLKACFNFIIGNGRREFISTQKITQWFVGSVLAAWIYIFVCLCTKNSDITITSTQLIQIIRDYIIQDCKITISIGIALGIWAFFKIIPLFLWSDNLKGMTED
ncbi:MAG: hypothetical protein K2I85_01160 [Alistipes sp.]|nr:hypothetical protein [Alistipes sp.]